jgi:hypothetical protein
VRIATALVPKELAVAVTDQRLPSGLSPKDWDVLLQILSAVKAAIPDAHLQPIAYVKSAIDTCPKLIPHAPKQ